MIFQNVNEKLCKFNLRIVGAEGCLWKPDHVQIQHRKIILIL